MTDEFLAGQRVTAAALNAATRKAIGRATRTSASSTTTTEIGVLRIDDIPITAGRIYRVISSPLGLDSSVTNDEIFAQIRYTTDGSTPTTSSTALPGSRIQTRQTDANVQEDKIINATYTPGADQTFSALLCVGRIAGTGNCSIIPATNGITEFTIVDMGVDPGDTGTDI